MNRRDNRAGNALPYTVPRSLLVAALIAFVVGILLIKPFLGTVMASALIAFIFNPVYKAVLRRSRRSGLAVTLGMFTALLSFIVPVVIIIGVTVSQASELVDSFQEGAVALGPAQVDETLQRGADRVNGVLHAVPGGESIQVDREDLKQGIHNLASEAVQGLVHIFQNVGGAFFSLTTTVVLAFFLIAAMWRHQVLLASFVKALSPFDKKVTSLYLDQAGGMTKAMVKGQLIIAVCQGFASAGSLWLVGIDYFWFFFVLLTFLSFIPLGAGILTIPIGIIIMLTGDVYQGLFVVLWHLLVVTNIDNILRPALVPKSVRLNPALTLLAVFSGLAIFGLVGVVYGPVIMILVVTTLRLYADQAKLTQKPVLPEFQAATRTAR